MQTHWYSSGTEWRGKQFLVKKRTWMKECCFCLQTESTVSPNCQQPTYTQTNKQILNHLVTGGNLDVNTLKNKTSLTLR